MRDEDGDIYDVIAGTFFLEKYWQRFIIPGMFLKLNGKIICVPVAE